MTQDGFDANADTHADPAGPPAAPLPAGATLGRYQVIKRLGGGGMGVVYVAHDPELDRKLALKLLRPAGTGGISSTEGRARLLREAQALARLAHPNVIAVHDVGTLGDQVFVAMELVDGVTLADWLAQRPRGWREVLAVFLQAGRGLEAAHAAGLVHRDFKPDNVLVGRDGRVRVLDFGLARAAGEPEPPASETPLHSPLVAALTHSGAFLGTPAYMSPEQLQGARSDNRADQFSFCVALYEGLYGSRPFGGDSFDDLREAVTAGKIPESPPDREVPAWLREVVVRGLRVDPAGRHPSMTALLEALAHDPARNAHRSRWAAAAVVVLAASALLVWRVTRGQAPPPCQGSERKLAGVWDPERKQAVHAAFAATARPFAEDAYRGVEQGLDARAAQWTAMHTDACQATRVRGEQSEEMLDLRMACLADRLREMRVLVGLFAGGDAKLVEGAVAAVARLPAVADCAQLSALGNPAPPPPDPGLRANLAVLREQLASVRALDIGGRYAEALDLAGAAAASAGGLGYRPLEAEALFAHGHLLDRAGDLRAAEVTLERALDTAEASRNDVVAARALTELIWVVGYEESRGEEALKRQQRAAGAIERLGGDDQLQAALDGKLAVVLERLGRYDEALAWHQRVLALLEPITAPGDPALAAALNNMANVQFLKGSYDQALASYRRALAILEPALGQAHPLVAVCLDNIGNCLQRLGKMDQAIDFHQRALAAFERLGAESVEAARAIDNLGLCYRAQGKLAEAAGNHRRAAEMREKLLGADHPEVATSWVNLADVYVLQERYADALALYQRALPVLEKTLGGEHPHVAYALTAAGEAALYLEQPARAVAPLTRALAVRLAHAAEPMQLARTEFLLALALWDSGGDRRRAVELARAARVICQAAGDAAKVELGQIDDWLGKHR